MLPIFIAYITDKESANHGNRASLPELALCREFSKMSTLAT
jgi:hypothetical protein